MIQGTVSPNISDLGLNYSESKSNGSSYSYREQTSLLKIALIEKEFNQSLSISRNDQNFKMPTEIAFIEAEKLIPQLFLFDEPLVSFIADGSILFQWTKKPDSILTASVCGEGTIIFAGIFNRTKTTKKLSGTLSFQNYLLPKEIKELLTKYFPDEKFQWVN